MRDEVQNTGVVGVERLMCREVNLPTLLAMSEPDMIDLFAERGLWRKRELCEGAVLGVMP
eukprot:4812660-Amphidinium_carterae.1